MTQPGPEIATNEEEAQLVPASTDDGAAQEEVAESYLDILTRAVTETSPAPEDRSEPEDVSQPLAQESRAPEVQLEDWVNQVAENPKAITRVPQSKQADVLQALLARERSASEAKVETAVQKAAREAEERIQQRTAIEARVAEIDRMRAEDPDEFTDWAVNNGEAYDAYVRVKAWQKQQAEKKEAPVADQVAQSESQRANAVAFNAIEKLKGNSTAHAEALEFAKTQGPTFEGAQAVVEYVNAKLFDLAQKPDDKAEERATRREQAAEHRRALPRADVSPGRAAIGNAPDSSDWRELAAQGLQESIQQGR